ncbi:MAG: Hsp70 family protein, partial [Deltaproteobacteria bacterium]|nr:Hsp70 family protein [Deltaproteobacteria bacterium]
GESRIFDENEPLGELVFEGLRAAPRGKVEIEVIFEIDTNGILQVSAVDTATGHRQRAHVELLGGVNESQIEEMQQRQEEMPAPLSE